MSSFRPLEGGCLCGAVRYRVTQPPLDSGYCHCRMCQRVSGAPAQVWVQVPLDGLAWSKGAPQAYRSSDRAERLFCRSCGSSLAFRSWPEPTTIELNAGTLDDPAAVPPRRHIWTESQLPWFHLDDGLPRHRRDG